MYNFFWPTDTDGYASVLCQTNKTDLDCLVDMNDTGTPVNCSKTFESRKYDFCGTFCHISFNTRGKVYYQTRSRHVGN